MIRLHLKINWLDNKLCCQTLFKHIINKYEYFTYLVPIFTKFPLVLKYMFIKKKQILQSI